VENFTRKIMGMNISLDTADFDHLTSVGIIDYVNDIWKEVDDKYPNIADTQQICILAALEIADKMMKLKNLQENMSGKCEKKLNRLIKELEEVKTSIS
jgi:cell division protein ZapA (FtsZ GTPase activity inhibitor)